MTSAARRVGTVALAGLLACACSADGGAGADSPTTTPTTTRPAATLPPPLVGTAVDDPSSLADIEAACELLGELYVTSSQIDATDLDSMRSALPAVVDVFDRLEPLAPRDIAPIVSAAATSIREWDRRIAQEGFVLDAGSFDRLSVDLVGPAELLAGWVDANCPADTGAGVLTDTTLRVCLGRDATAAEIDALFERVTVTVPGGTEVELLEGVVGLGRQRDGIFVTVDAFATDERIGELEAILAAPPVVTVWRGAAQC